MQYKNNATTNQQDLSIPMVSIWKAEIKLEGRRREGILACKHHTQTGVFSEQLDQILKNTCIH